MSGYEPCRDCKIDNIRGFVGRTQVTLCAAHEQEYQARHEAAVRSCSHFYKLQQEGASNG